MQILDNQMDEKPVKNETPKESLIDLPDMDEFMKRFE